MVIGKLEELTLMAALRAGSEALPSEIYQRVQGGQKSAAFGAVYTTLTRLTVKGFLKETVRRDDAGRERRAFTISAGGRAALAEALQATAKIGGLSLGGWDVAVE
jgi:DNA-binding PadR family transcriptional regulator